MKNIIFFTNKLVGGGAEKTILNLVSYINEHEYGIKAYFVALWPDKRIQNDYDNIIVLKNQTSPGQSKITKAIIKFKQIQELRKLKIDLSIDISISFLFCSDWMNVFSGVGERKICSIRTTESKFCKNSVHKIFERFIWNKNDYIVSISESVRKDLINYYSISPKKIITIYNPTINVIEENEASSNQFKEDIINNVKKILTIGRLAPEKGQWHLIKAIYVLVNEKKVDNIRLYLVGDGELRGELAQLVKELHLEEYVIFEGFRTNPTYYMNNADLFVFSSLTEGLGNALVEAISCQLPIVSVDCISGPRELLAPGTDYALDLTDMELAEYGILVPPFNPTQNRVSSAIEDKDRLFADAILKMISDESLMEEYRKKLMIRSHDFEMSNIVEQWMKITETL